MEATTPFDLNRAIEQWRESLRQNPAFCRENLEELESHLRDSIANLRERDLSDEEAFLVATRRAGSGSMLGAEFGKINVSNMWFDRVLWMLIGIQLIRLFSSVIEPITLGITIFGVRLYTSYGEVVTMPSFWVGLLHVCSYLLCIGITVKTVRWVVIQRSVNSSAWLRSMVKGRWRLPIVTAGFLIAGIFPYVNVLCQNAIRRNFTPPGGMVDAWFLLWVTQTATLITITLLLVRRQWLSKT